MKITKACDYAMRALIYMGNSELGKIHMRSELSKATNVPDSFLGKILQSLAKSNILVSVRGKKGGFKIDKALNDITMYDVIVAVEGDLEITDCIADEEYCTSTGHCKVHLVWCEIQDQLISKLKGTTIKALC